jgi:type I restriction enzyme M protein
VQHLVEKYAVTFAQTEQNIRKAESSLSEMMGQLTGSLSDLQGIAELQKLFK